MTETEPVRLMESAQEPQDDLHLIQTLNILANLFLHLENSLTISVIILHDQPLFMLLQFGVEIFLKTTQERRL